MNKNKKSHTQILTQKESQNSNPSINSSIKYSINSSISEPANKSEIKSKGSSLESTTQSISSHQSLASTTHTSNSRYTLNTKAENKNTWQQLSQQIEATLQSIGLQKGSKIAVGVSGGADSVFLALALHRLGFYVNAVIIDHKLRQNSTQEAIYTANTMQQHNIKADILTWNHQNKHDNPNFQYQSENRENNKQDEQENENETNLNNLDNNFNNTIKTINETNITKSSQHVITQNQNDASLQLQTQPSQSIISLQQINRSHQATHNNTNKNTSMETTETEMKGMETKAREARYALFQKYCTQHNIKHLFIAHHLNDQVETFFINLFRGSGIKGLCAMQTCSKLQTKQTSNIANPTTNNIAENPNFQYQSENRENNKQDEQENENETNTTDPSLHNSAANQNPSTVKQSTTILNKQKFAKLKHLQQITILSNALMQSSNSSQRGRISKLQQLLTNITTSSNGKSTLMRINALSNNVDTATNNNTARATNSANASTAFSKFTQAYQI